MAGEIDWLAAVFGWVLVLVVVAGVVVVVLAGVGIFMLENRG